jgi:hypothetical protein
MASMAMNRIMKKTAISDNDVTRKRKPSMENDTNRRQRLVP